MAYRNKAYVCFDGDNDIHFYRLMTAWHEHESIDFTFYDAHDLKQARDTSTEQTIKRSLRERLNNSREFIVLIGENTKNLFKFVRWEMEVALDLNLPIIAVYLDGSRSINSRICPPIISDKLAIHIPYSIKSMKFALENWPSWHITHQKNGKTGPFYYEDHVYKNLGL